MLGIRDGSYQIILYSEKRVGNYPAILCMENNYPVAFYGPAVIIPPCFARNVIIPQQRVEDYMNSNEFAARDGGGLGSLAACLHERCSRVSALKGERLRS